MKLIISTQVINAPSYYETRDAISHDWIKYLQSHCINPILIPNVLDDLENFIQCLGPLDGLILTNGNDLECEGANKKHISPERNQTEELLIKIALRKEIKILGVCRGLQIINKYFGGSISKIDSDIHVNKNHKVKIHDASFIEKIGKGELDVNSYHNFGVYQQDLSKDLSSFALGPKNIIEGLYHPHKNILAFQWHPERKLLNPGPTRDLFINFLKTGRFW